MLKGDKRSLARLMTYVDNRHPEILDIMSEILKRKPTAKKIGITGPPGAGKSTLVDKLISEYRNQNLKVGVVCIDPSSPFSGGAVLGDRIRMQNHAADDGVFIRSLGSHGAHGGLSRATRDIVHLLEASGVDVVIIETVGVGQTELDIMSVADCTVVVLVPEAGDTVQTMKAGLMEIADIFVVNKSDREGADKMFMELKSLSEMYSTDNWKVPVTKTSAVKKEGIKDLIELIDSYLDFLKEEKKDSEKKALILKQECLDIVLAEVAKKLQEVLSPNDISDELKQELFENENTYEAAKLILEKM